MCLRSQVHCKYTDLYGYLNRMTRVDNLAAVSLVILWSSGFIGADLGTAQAPAHTLLAWRYVVAVAILAAWCWYRGLRPTWRGVRRQTVLGFFCQFLYLGCLVTGVGLGVPAGTAALIAALQPLVVAALSSRFLGEEFPASRRIGLAVGFTGVVLVVAGDLGGGAAAWPVYLLPLGGTLALSAGTVLERRLGTTEPIPLALCIQAAVSAVLFMAWSLIAGDATPPLTTRFWAAVAWVVVFSTFGAYGTYLFVLRRNGATRVSALLYLTPATTMLWAWMMFGDRITWLAVVGLAVTLVGVCGSAAVGWLGGSAAVGWLGGSAAVAWLSALWDALSCHWRGAPTASEAPRPSRRAARTSRSSAETPGSPRPVPAGSYRRESSDGDSQ